MAKRDFRTVNMTDGQMVEYDKVLKRIGDVSYRDLGVFSKILFNSGNLLVSSGLKVTPLSGMQVSIAEGSGIQGTALENFPFMMTAAQTLTLSAASGVARTDIIEMQVQSRFVKNDFSKAILDPSIGEISTVSVKRDVQYFAAFQAKTGTTTPTAATAGVLTGTKSIATTVDLSSVYLLNICDGEDGEFVEINIQGATPESTTKAEIVAKINAAVGRTMASISGNYIVLTGNGTGVTSYFELKPPTSNSALDAINAVLGLSSSGFYNYSYRGTNEWIKICEIDIGTATTTITSSMIRDILQKTTWASGSTRIEFSESIEKSSNGNLLPIPLSSSNKTLSGLEARYDGFILSGTLTENVNLVVPTAVRAYQIINNCAGAYAVTVKTSSGTGVVCGIGERKIVFCDGTNVVECANDAAVLMGTTITGTDILAAIVSAFQGVYSAKKMWFNVGADCTNIPSVAWWRIEAEGSASSIVIKARIFGGYNEWTNYYSSSAWTGWIQSKGTAGGTTNAMMSAVNTTTPMATIVAAAAAGLGGARNHFYVQYNASATGMPSQDATNWFVETITNLERNYIVIIAHKTGDSATYENGYNVATTTFSGWKQILDGAGRATKISVPVISATACLPVILANPYVPQFSASGVTDITIHGASVYGMIHCDWRSDTEVHVTFKHNASFAEYENYYASSVWKGWVKTKDADGNAVNANSLGGVAAASYALKTDNVASAVLGTHSGAESFIRSSSTTYAAIYAALISAFGSSSAWKRGVRGTINGPAVFWIESASYDGSGTITIYAAQGYATLTPSTLTMTSGTSTACSCSLSF